MRGAHTAPAELCVTMARPNAADDSAVVTSLLVCCVFRRVKAAVCLLPAVPDVRRVSLGARTSYSNFVFAIGCLHLQKCCGKLDSTQCATCISGICNAVYETTI